MSKEELLAGGKSKVSASSTDSQFIRLLLDGFILQEVMNASVGSISFTFEGLQPGNTYLIIVDGTTLSTAQL